MKKDVMDSFRFYLGNVEELSFDNLLVSSVLTRNYDRSYRLYRKDEVGENDWHLFVDVKETYGGWKIRVRGSIRKWYFGKLTFRDLTRTDFENCIDLINERLGLKKDELWGARTCLGEISLTLKMRPEMRFCLRNFVSYKGFEVMRVGNDYLKFFGEKKTLKFYNSGAKNWKERNLSVRKIERLERHFVIFRVEATIKDISRVEQGMEDLFETPGKILKNWNVLYEKLRMYVNDVNCFGVSSSQRFELKNGGKKEFQIHLLRSGIEFLSPEVCFADVGLLKNAKARYETKLWLRKILSENGYASSSKDELLLYMDRKIAKISA